MSAPQVSRRALGWAMAAVALWTLGWALAAIDARATYGARTSGDEPQYLTTALSLGTEGDLDISDEIAERRFEPYHEIGLSTQTVELNPQGQRLSPHDPLLPALLALPMRLGGWVAAKAALAVFAAAVAAATLWLSVRRLGVRPLLGAAVVGAFFAAPPLVAYGTQVYPEMPAALCATLAVAAATGPLRRRGRAVVIVAVVALCWLSVKYVPVAAALALAVAVRQWHARRRREAAADVAIYVAAALVYLGFRWQIYGGWTVYAAGDHFVTGEFTVVGRRPDFLGRTRRLVGLLTDRQFGLAAWMPAFGLVPAGLAVLARLRPLHWWVTLGAFATGYAVATWLAFTMHGWWWPGRQLVVVLPLAVAAIALAAQHVRGVGWAVAASWVLSAVGWVWLVVEASTGRRALIVDFAETPYLWYRAWSSLLPDYQAFTGVWPVVAHWAWAAALAATAWLAVRRCGPGRAP